jgi:hypothetical protein
MEESNGKSVILFEVVGITSDLSFEQYDRLLRHPLWGLVAETLIYTRSYEDGLRVADKLLELSERYRTRMAQEQYLANVKTLLRFSLSMLDKLDRWDEYLKLWTELRGRTDLVDVIRNASTTLRRHYGSGLDQWIIREDSSALHLQFLWVTDSRKNLIEKKLHKQKTGGKLGNVRHAPRSELTAEETRQRYEFMLRKAEYFEKMQALIKSLVSSIKTPF